MSLWCGRTAELGRFILPCLEISQALDWIKGTPSGHYGARVTIGCQSRSQICLCLLRDSVWAQLLHGISDSAEHEPPVPPNQEWSEIRVLVLWSKEFFAVSMSKIPLKLGKGFYLLIKGSFGIPSQWDSMQREFSESSLKINSIWGGESPEINP